MIEPLCVGKRKNMREASRRFNPWWFYQKVRRGGELDFRAVHEEYRAFGNYHYGAVATAMGFPRWLILRAAGWEHWWSGCSIPAWKRPWSYWPYGDDPEDSLNIVKGILDARDEGFGVPILSRLAWRAFDVAASFLFLVLTWPLTLVLAGLILLSSGRPAFDGSWRLGQYGVPFRCWKLRTLRNDHADILEAHLAANPRARKEWQTYAKLISDPRVTPIGRWLRKSSLDDLLAQPWNILKGDMSLFGPRAFLVSERPKLGRAGERILSVKPGWVSFYGAYGRAGLTFQQRIAFEDGFAQNLRSWRVKWVALKGTVKNCLGQKGT